MSRNISETAASGQPDGTRSWRLPAWVIGAIAGEAGWGLAILGAHLFEAYEQWFPEWFLRMDLADTLGSICEIMAFPVALGGWMFIWGDSGGPHPWVDSLAFNVGFGLCLYALLGVMIGLFVSRRSRRR